MQRPDLRHAGQKDQDGAVLVLVGDESHERLDELDQASHHLYVTLSPSRYELMGTLNVNLERPKAAWRRAAALIKLCDELERAVARSLGA